MSVGISLEELLAWNEQSADYWKTHLEANPALLELPCDIGGTANVQGFVRHIWGVELRWSQRLAGLPVIDREKLPAGPLDALFDLHRQAAEIFRNLLARAGTTWSEPFVLDFDWVPPEQRTVSRRKIAACTRCSTASAIGRNWRHWCAPPASPPSSGATCCSVPRCASRPLRWLRRRRAASPVLLKARAAQHRPALRRLEGNGGLRAALRARRARLGPHPLRSARALRLALLAVFGVVLELFIVEKELLAGRKNKLGAAVDTLQDSIGEFHGRLASQGITPKSATARSRTCRSRFPVLFLVAQQGPGPH